MRPRRRCRTTPRRPRMTDAPLPAGRWPRAIRTADRTAPPCRSATSPAAAGTASRQRVVGIRCIDGQGHGDTPGAAAEQEHGSPRADDAKPGPPAEAQNGQGVFGLARHAGGRSESAALPRRAGNSCRAPDAARCPRRRWRVRRTVSRNRCLARSSSPRRSSPPISQNSATRCARSMPPAPTGSMSTSWTAISCPTFRSGRTSSKRSGRTPRSRSTCI